MADRMSFIGWCIKKHNSDMIYRFSLFPGSSENGTFSLLQSILLSSYVISTYC